MNFHYANQNVKDFVFCIFQYIRGNALNEWKTNYNTNSRNDKERVETKQVHLIQTHTIKAQTDDEIPQRKEESRKRLKQTV